MKKKKRLTASHKRAASPTALARFALRHLVRQLPFTFPVNASLPPSPKSHYRSTYLYLGYDALCKMEAWRNLSLFDIAVCLFDYSNLEPLLASYVYQPSAKGQVPFHPVSMYLLVLYRREHKLSRPEVLRRLRDPHQGPHLRRIMGFLDDLPSEAGLRHFEKCLVPKLQMEINALQINALYRANLLPTKPDDPQGISLSFDGMLHQARSRMRCAHVRDSCYQPAPRPCPARQKGKRGCTCQQADCAQRCRYAPSRDPEARLVVYTGNNKHPHLSPNSPSEGPTSSKSGSRFVYGYYSYSGQLLDHELSTYWIMPAAWGPATQGDRSLFPENFTFLQQRFPWLQIDAVFADAGAGYQKCLDLIWEAGALRMVDIVSSPTDKDPAVQLKRGYDDKGHPLCPFGYVMHSNGHDYCRRRTKWRCSKSCLLEPAEERPACDYLQEKYEHGYTVTVGRTHADGNVRLAREVPYGSDRWKQLYHRRNCAESRNSVLENMGLKRLPVHGSPHGHVTVLQADFIANQHTLIRLIREANALSSTE